MNTTQALNALAGKNVFLNSLTTRQMENFIDGSTTDTLRTIAQACRMLPRERMARRFAIEAEAEVSRRTRTAH